MRRPARALAISLVVALRCATALGGELPLTAFGEVAVAEPTAKFQIQFPYHL